MDFTALDLAPSVLPATFLVAGWMGLAWLAWRWAKSGDWRRLAAPARLPPHGDDPRYARFIALTGKYDVYGIHRN